MTSASMIAQVHIHVATPKNSDYPTAQAMGGRYHQKYNSSEIA